MGKGVKTGSYLGSKRGHIGQIGHIWTLIWTLGPRFRVLFFHVLGPNGLKRAVLACFGLFWTPFEPFWSLWLWRALGGQILGVSGPLLGSK